jgi:hypothetical protein
MVRHPEHSGMAHPSQRTTEFFVLQTPQSSVPSVTIIVASPFPTVAGNLYHAPVKRKPPAWSFKKVFQA